MVILRSQNKIDDFFMILAWASPFNPLKPIFVKTEPPGRKYNTLLRLDQYYYSEFKLKKIFFFKVFFRTGNFFASGL